MTDLFGESSVSAAKGIYRTQAATELSALTDEQIMALFGDMTLMSPGLVPLSDWRPELSPRPLCRGADSIANARSRRHPVTPDH